DAEGGEILGRLLLDHIPSRNHDERRDERRQDDERHREADETERVERGEGRNSRQLFHALHFRGGGVEIRPEKRRQTERDRARDERHRTSETDRPLAERKRREATRDGQPNEHTENGPIELHSISLWLAQHVPSKQC